MKKTLAPLALGALLLTGCGAAQSEAPKSTAATSEARQPSTPATATVQQFASVISENQDSMRKYESEAISCNMARGSTSNDPIQDATATACDYDGQTYALTAKTIHRELTALGTPPQSLDPLVSRTLDSAQKIMSYGVGEKCVDNQSPACQDALRSMQEYVQYGGITGVLDAWKPYM